MALYAVYGTFISACVLPVFLTVVAVVEAFWLLRGWVSSALCDLCDGSDGKGGGGLGSLDLARVSKIALVVMIWSSFR